MGHTPPEEVVGQVLRRDLTGHLISVLFHRKEVISFQSLRISVSLVANASVANALVANASVANASVIVRSPTAEQERQRSVGLQGNSVERSSNEFAFVYVKDKM